MTIEIVISGEDAAHVRQQMSELLGGNTKSSISVVQETPAPTSDVVQFKGKQEEATPEPTEEPVKKKRKRRTKAEIAADKEAEKAAANDEEESKSNFDEDLAAAQAEQEKGEEKEEPTPEPTEAPVEEDEEKESEDLMTKCRTLMAKVADEAGPKTLNTIRDGLAEICEGTRPKLGDADVSKLPQFMVFLEALGKADGDDEKMKQALSDFQIVVG